MKILPGNYIIEKGDDKMETGKYLEALQERANKSCLLSIRFKDWQSVIKWEIGTEEFYWSSSEKGFSIVTAFDADIVLKVSLETLKRLAGKELPFFIGIWATGDIEYKGSFGDAFRLGYIFLNDNRKRKVVFYCLVVE